MNNFWTLASFEYKKIFVRKSAFTYKELAQLTQEQADDYYNIRMNQYRLNLENNDTFSTENIERVMEIDSQVQKPFIVQYADGYFRNLALSTTNTITIMFLIIFVISPVFSNEYQRNTDNLILTAKNGKKITVWAKTFVALSSGTFITTLLLAISFVGCMLAHGTEEANHFSVCSLL